MAEDKSRSIQGVFFKVIILYEKLKDGTEYSIDDFYSFLFDYADVKDSRAQKIWTQKLLELGLITCEHPESREPYIHITDAFLSISEN